MGLEASAEAVKPLLLFPNTPSPLVAGLAPLVSVEDNTGADENPGRGGGGAGAIPMGVLVELRPAREPRLEPPG